MRSKKAAAELRDLLAPILLQRKKSECEVLNLPNKHEVVVWIPLSSAQRKMYDPLFI
jgi:SNF2 family DNA or RNA helicase